ncbi:MAG: hypothetical protein EBT08_21180, partial [Betaproteobacteria bacterium]|nr:hypothetical protein [Betaproteobacteria bacterium]
GFGFLQSALLKQLAGLLGQLLGALIGLLPFAHGVQDRACGDKGDLAWLILWPIARFGLTCVQFVANSSDIGRGPGFGE